MRVNVAATQVNREFRIIVGRSQWIERLLLRPTELALVSASVVPEMMREEFTKKDKFFFNKRLAQEVQANDFPNSP